MNIHWKDWMLKLKLQYFGYLMRWADSLKKTLMLGKIESKWRSGWQRMRLLDSITDSTDMDLSKLQETVKDKQARHDCSLRNCKELDMTYWLNNKNNYLSSYCNMLGKGGLYAQSCLTLQLPMDYSLPCSSVHGISQAGILKWAAISYSRGSLNSGIELISLVSPPLAGIFFTTAPLGSPHCYLLLLIT